MSAINFLMRQAGSIGGGTTEMARNVISERVLGMPRERRLDKDVPFRDVPAQPPDHDLVHPTGHRVARRRCEESIRAHRHRSTDCRSPTR